jgi:2,5-diamino-6-(ribosylamino)-4(3H)-pyrimidinone 5'-phosphate reductase
MRPAERPRCFLNVAMSLDGKIASLRRELPGFSSRADRRMMDRIRARADAVLVGGGTLRAADFPLRVRSPRLRRKRLLSGRPEQPLNILLTGSLAVPVRGRFFRALDTRRLVVTTEMAPAGRSRLLRTSSEFLVLGRDRVSLKRLMRELHSRGIRELLLEGGGETNAGFFRLGLVDEIYLTLCPVIIGGARSPTPVDGRGFLPGKFPRFRLVSFRPEGSELFLHLRRFVAPSGR